jgi:hypothetical protein
MISYSTISSEVILTKALTEDSETAVSIQKVADMAVQHRG